MAGAGNVDAGSSELANIIDKGPYTAAQVIMLVIALLLNMLDGFDVAAMAFAAHSIGNEFAITPDRLGILFSVALAGMMLGAMFLSPLSDVFGRRPTLIACIVMIAASMTLTVYATELYEFIILRFLTGLGVGSMLACLTALTSEYTPSVYRSFAIVTITAGYPLGVSLGGFFAAPLVPEMGWRIVFLIGGIATFLMAFLVFFFVPESLAFLASSKKEAALNSINKVLARLKREPLSAMPVLEAQNEAQKTGNVKLLLSADYRVKTLGLWLTFFLCFVSLYFLLSWIPKLIVNAGLPESTGIYASTAFTGGGTLGIIVLGWIATRYSLIVVISAFLVAAAVGLIAFSLFNGINYLITALFVIGFFHAGGFTGLYAVAAKMYPTQARATGVGWAIGLGRFGAVVGPYIGGLLIAVGMSLENILMVFSVPLLISGLFAWFLAVR